MEPFSLICKSCAARLKVTKPAAVGQILACPKCGTMIEVKPPKGWVPPEPVKSDADADADSQITDSRDAGKEATDDWGGQFDDIDSILATPDKRTQPPAHHPSPRVDSVSSQPVVKPTAVIHTKRSQQAAREKNKASTVAAGPVLPTDQWTSDSTKKRKRIVFITIGIAGSIILLATIVTAIIVNRGEEIVLAPGQTDTGETGVDRSMADSIDSDPVDGDAHPDEENQRDTSAADPDSATNGNPLTGPPKTDDAPPELTTEPTIPGDQANQNSDQESNNGTDPNTEPDAQEAQDGVSSPFASENPSHPNGTLPGGLGTAPSNSTTQSAELSNGVTNKLGDLATLLEQSGTSLRDIKDAAVSRQGKAIVGIPKYIVKTPRTEPFDLNRALALPIGGVMYDSPTPLVAIVRNLTAISGVPMTVDAKSIIMAGRDPSPLVTVKISNADLEGALEEILEESGLAITRQGSGIVIGVASSPILKESKFALPNEPVLDEKGQQRLLTAIKTLVNPATWVREQNQPSLKIEGSQLVANCSEGSKNQIEDLLLKLAATAVLIQDPENADASNAIESRWRSATPKLSKSPNLTHSVQMNIGRFLNQFDSKTGMTVLMDWSHVIDEGWTPLTLIPGGVNESSVHDVLLELEQSMNLVALAVDSKTIVLTTHAQASAEVDLEVYSVSKLLAGPLDHDKIKDLIQQTLRVQLQSSNVRLFYEPSFQCLIVSGPQALQRHVDSLLKQLESL